MQNRALACGPHTRAMLVEGAPERVENFFNQYTAEINQSQQLDSHADMRVSFNTPTDI